MRHSLFACCLHRLLVSWLLLSPLTVSGAATSTAHLEERKTATETHEYDVVVYGNTVAAIAAAIQTVRMGKTAVLVSPKSRLGGMTASGLGWTDAKDGNAISGIAREFYSKVYQRYQNNTLWTKQSRTTYVDKRIQAQPGVAVDEKLKVQWTFEPRIAQQILEDWVKEEKVPVFRNISIKQSKQGVTKQGATITSLVAENGTVFRGKMFIDAGYEGDLMDAAGIPWNIGRESEQQYNESVAGIRINNQGKQNLDISKDESLNIDPYITKGKPSSGLINGITEVIEDPLAEEGKADKIRLQAYTYRLCLTQVKNNQVPFSKPNGYKEATYEILFRYLETGYRGPFFTRQLMPNLKTDSNAEGQVSTDLPGGAFNSNSNYPMWTYAQREQAAQTHKAWIQGLLFTLAHHSRVPQSVRAQVSTWGYAKDEFVDNGNFPYELYIREGRRMQGMYTMKQSDIETPKGFKADSVVATGSYTFDVHRLQRVVVDNQTFNEGGIHVPNKKPFPIPYGAIVPEAKYATNFLNPVTMSSTHVAFSAIRMEPTYMMMGQSAGVAAVMAIEKKVNVQDVDRTNLKKRIQANGEEENAGSAVTLSRFGAMCLVLSTIYAIVQST
ncbi:hypothetical protein NLU13_4794 [Sarocladium strictum]|uniref:FAD dependent oxidoreductase n=1 Tax=Sarocladium strictum TaxID=5046 RepID=A0AA39GJW5_SARSR|nr:hypothetical protein NLU13_4794 [Sarocladium strictum]